MAQRSPARRVPPARPKAPARRVSEVDKQPLAYVASPVACYSTPRYDAMLAHARRAFPGVELLPARGLYRDNAHWLVTWPGHLKRLTVVCFFPDTDRSIGRGVMKELDDARAAGVPVHLLTDDGTLVPYERLRLTLIDGGESWRRYMRVTIKPTQKQPDEVAATT